jgi:hypothetical protein
MHAPLATGICMNAQYVTMGHEPTCRDLGHGVISRPSENRQRYGSSDISLVHSDSGQAREVLVRTFPIDDTASANLVM